MIAMPSTADEVLVYNRGGRVWTVWTGGGVGLSRCLHELRRCHAYFIDSVVTPAMASRSVASAGAILDFPRQFR